MNGKDIKLKGRVLKKITSGAGIIFLSTISFLLGAGVAYGYFSVRINEIRKLFPPISEFASVIGDVVSISSGEIVIDVVNVPKTPFEKLPERRKIFVTEETPIVKLSTKPSGEYEKETAEYGRQQAFLRCSALGNFVPNLDIPTRLLETPNPYSEEILNISGISSGDRILVVAGEGIKMKESFPAVKIIVQPK